MVKKRTPPRKSSSPKKRVRKAARTARKASTRAKATRGVDFNPVKKKLRAHIVKLEKQLGGPEARAAAVDLKGWETLDQLKDLNDRMTNICQPTMVIPNS